MIAARAVGVAIPLRAARPASKRSRGPAVDRADESIEPTHEELEAAFARSAAAVRLRHVPDARVAPGSARRPAADRQPVLRESLA